MTTDTTHQAKSHQHHNKEKNAGQPNPSHPSENMSSRLIPDYAQDN